VSALKAADVDVTYYEYPNENHYMYAAWAPSMKRTLAFLRTHLAR
jgi:dipeptidyl aminopeptidase/acylaminoacyl peptidase